MSEEAVNNWPSEDVLVGYDPELEQIRWTALSTGAVLHVHDLKAPSESVIRPFWVEVTDTEN